MLLAFAEKYHFPVATTLSGKGIFPEDHPLSLGIYGYSGSPRAIKVFKDPGLEGIILLGVDTTQWSTMLWSPELQLSGRTIQVEYPDGKKQLITVEGVVPKYTKPYVSAEYISKDCFRYCLDSNMSSFKVPTYNGLLEGT